MYSSGMKGRMGDIPAGERVHGLIIQHNCPTKDDARHVHISTILLPILRAYLDVTLARTIIAPAELPIGILTALIGAPFFLWLLLQSQRKNMLL